jgi:hypothetical protein
LEFDRLILQDFGIATLWNGHFACFADAETDMKNKDLLFLRSTRSIFAALADKIL